MSTLQHEWLPPLIEISEYKNNWEIYVEKLYDCFKKDFVDTENKFNSKNLTVPKKYFEDGKLETFWHIISENYKDIERLPDLRRCERILWPKAILTHCDLDCIKVWENIRGNGNKRVCIWFEEYDFLVILGKGSNFYILITAYPISREHKRVKLKKEYLEYCEKVGDAN